MVVVHHAGHAVEPEAVELVLLHPVTEVAQQESKNLVMPVVEESTIPELVPTTTTFMEVLVVRAIEEVEPIENVLAGMRVHNVEEDGDAHAVSCIDELSQFLGGTIAGARGEEARDLVSKGYCGDRQVHVDEAQ